MESTINNLLEIIEKSNKWVLAYLQGEKQKNAYQNFVTSRRKLNKKKKALEGNPAAALFGESQVGKSYLISSLLSEPEKPFSIENKKGEAYNFIEEINPPGGGSESTSLVTRFSTKYKPFNQQYPVKAKLLSPADIVLVLCDSYYNDIKATHGTVLQKTDIEKEIDNIKGKLLNHPDLQTVFTEDDVLDIQDYIADNFQQKAGEVLHSNFFEEIPLLIAKIKSSEWKDVFSLLWNKNDEFTNLFNKLIDNYEKLKFKDTLYLPLEAVLYKYGTLLDIERLKEIYNPPKQIEPNYKQNTPVMFIENGQEKEIESFPKNFLCALSAELIFSQPDTLLGIKPFLSETDLLDFPGARARKTSPENMINQGAMPDLLKRGKVAYLFNKYTDAEIINVLLFCAKHEQAGERTMPEILNNWVSKMVGDSPENREIFIKKSQISPLFIIGTWFNVNLQYNPQLDKNEDKSSLNYRWNQRFDRTLAEEKIDTNIYNWFTNWTTSQPNFQNIFLLRDFEKSDEYASKLFKGYRENKKELEEIKPTSYPSFKEKLRQSFLEYEFVKQHFKNPAEVWDRAASINEDGSQYIIDKLTIAANNINGARHEKTICELNAILQDVLNELKKYFHDSDSDANLRKAKFTAGKIQADLDVALGKIPYLFGQMMKDFMLKEVDVYNLYLQKIHDIERRDVVNMDKYSYLRMHVPKLNAKDDFETNLEYLRDAYEMPTKPDCKAHFERQGIDLEELFYGNVERVKNFSQVLADALESYWFDEHMLIVKKNLQEILNSEILEDIDIIQDMLRRLYKKLLVSEIVTEKIRSYVDGYRDIEEAYEMIADISTEIINKFINSVGTEYLSESDFNDLKEANEKNNLGLVLEHKALQFEKNTREEAAELITKITNLPELVNQNPMPIDAIKSLPIYRNYQVWFDLLKVALVWVCDIPNYDLQANNKLREIIDQCKTINY